jgi:hypothetical protein
VRETRNVRIARVCHGVRLQIVAAAPPGHRGGGNGLRVLAALAIVVSGVERGVFRRQRNAPNGGARPRARFAQAPACAA